MNTQFPEICLKRIDHKRERIQSVQASKLCTFIEQRNEAWRSAKLNHSVTYCEMNGFEFHQLYCHGHILRHCGTRSIESLFSNLLLAGSWAEASKLVELQGNIWMRNCVNIDSRCTSVVDRWLNSKCGKSICVSGLKKNSIFFFLRNTCNCQSWRRYSEKSEFSISSF